MTARGPGGKFMRRGDGPTGAGTVRSDPPADPSETAAAAAPFRLSIRPVSPPPPPDPEPGADPEPWPELPGDPSVIAGEDPATVLRAGVDVIDTVIRATMGEHRGADELERAEVARTAAPVVARWGLGDAAGRVVPDWAGELVSLGAAVWLAWGRAIADAIRSAWEAWRYTDEDPEDTDDPETGPARGADRDPGRFAGDAAAGGRVGGDPGTTALARPSGLPAGPRRSAGARPDYGVRVPPPVAGAAGDGPRGR